jgi:hypothetical protein
VWIVKVTMKMKRWDGRGWGKKKGGKGKGGEVMKGMGMSRRRVVSLLGELCVFLSLV